jgi:hypothetical protein
MAPKSEKSRCEICKKNKNLKACSACGDVFYCSAEHQKENWKSHKGNCKAYKVSHQNEIK